MLRFCNDAFSHDYLTTIGNFFTFFSIIFIPKGVDFKTKIIEIEGKQMKL